MQRVFPFSLAALVLVLILGLGLSLSFTPTLAQDGATPDSIMQSLATNSGYQVRRFELAVPSLTDIFIQVAGGNNNRNGG